MTSMARRRLSFPGGPTRSIKRPAQAMQTQRQMQAMEPRYDVRKKTPKSMQAKARQASKPLSRSQVLSSDGKVLWPGKAPSDGELGKSRAAAEEAIMAAYKEFKASGKASVQNVVEAKERLYAYGHPAPRQDRGEEPSGRPGSAPFPLQPRAVDRFAGRRLRAGFQQRHATTLNEPPVLAGSVMVGQPTRWRTIGGPLPGAGLAPNLGVD